MPSLPTSTSSMMPLPSLSIPSHLSSLPVNTPPAPLLAPVPLPPPPRLMPAALPPFPEPLPLPPFPPLPLADAPPVSFESLPEHAPIDRQIAEIPSPNAKPRIGQAYQGFE